ncbi:MAG: hypothetical protein ABI613_06950, partial [Gemmatimonadota bacterium]
MSRLFSGSTACSFARTVQVASFTALSLLPSSSLRAQTVAITGGTVYPVSGPKIENGTVILQNGRIIAVGREVPVPAGATQIDARGKSVVPGFVHASTTLGLSQVGSVDGTNESQKEGDLNPSFNVSEAIDPAFVNIAVARMEGVTSSISEPTGRFLPGQAVFIDLAGSRVDDMIVKSPVAMMVDLSEGSKGAGGGSRAGVMQRL